MLDSILSSLDSHSWIRTVVYTTMIYLFIINLIQVFGSRLLAQTHSSDMIALFLIAEASQTAIMGSNPTFLDSVVAITTVLSLNRLSRRIPIKFNFTKEIKLIENGSLIRANMQKAGVSSADILEAMAKKGGCSLSQVSRSIIDRGGIIQVYLKGGGRQTDDKTGLTQYWWLDENWGASVKLKLEKNIDMTLMVVDIKGMTQINEEHGYEAGNRVLREVPGAIRRTLREYDILLRYTEDRFLVLLQGNTSSAYMSAQGIRESIQNLQLRDTAISKGDIDCEFGLTPCAVSAEDGEFHNTLLSLEESLHKVKTGEVDLYDLIIRREIIEQEKRREIRTEIDVETMITLPSGEVIEGVTRDISNSGASLDVPPGILSVGDEIVIQVDGEGTPICPAIVERVFKDGVGVSFK